MSSIKLVLDDGKIGNSITNPEPGQIVSYADYYRGVQTNRGTIIRDFYGSAYGSARIVPGDPHVVGYTYSVEIVGKWEDVQKIIGHFDDELGVVYLRPKFFELPKGIATRKARIIYLLSYIKKIYVWVMENKQ